MIPPMKEIVRRGVEKRAGKGPGGKGETIPLSGLNFVYDVQLHREYKNPPAPLIDLQSSPQSSKLTFLLSNSPPMASTSVEHEDHNSASFKAEYRAYMRQAWSDDLTERRQAKFLDYFFTECDSRGLRGYEKMRLHSIFMLFIKEHMQETQPEFEKLVRGKRINEGFAADEKVWVQFKTESFPKVQPQPTIPFEYIMRPPPRVNWVQDPCVSLKGKATGSPTDSCEVIEDKLTTISREKTKRIVAERCVSIQCH
ncbi:MAG: hypothetical protein NXY57DRAFT_1027377 [Lentinula lateritia]|nr:MAG: hypothetical protein NXY57DRAFT_1027377 [Lentinula lateritia]